MYNIERNTNRKVLYIVELVDELLLAPPELLVVIALAQCELAKKRQNSRCFGK